MENYKDFLPKSDQTLVGDQTLIVNEFVCAKRDAVLSVALKDLEIGVVFQKLISLKDEGVEYYTDEELNALSDEELEELSKKKDGKLAKFGEVADIFKTMIMQLLTKNLTLVSCLTLDTYKNRKTLSIAEEEKPTENEVFGFEYNVKMFSWIKNNLTMKQEQLLLEKIIEVNDFAELVKNFSALAAKMMKSAGKDQTQKA